MKRAVPAKQKLLFICVLCLCLDAEWEESHAQGLVSSQDLDQEFSIGKGQAASTELADMQTGLKEAVFRQDNPVIGRVFIAPAEQHYTVTFNGQNLFQGQKRQDLDVTLGARLFFRAPFRSDDESYLSSIGFTVPRVTTATARSLFVFLAGSGNIIGRNLQGANQSSYWLASSDNLGTPTGTSQVGFGWQDGPLSLSLGYMDKNYKNAHMLKGMSMGHDGVTGFTFSFRPN